MKKASTGVSLSVRPSDFCQPRVAVHHTPVSRTMLRHHEVDRVGPVTFFLITAPILNRAALSESGSTAQTQASSNAGASNSTPPTTFPFLCSGMSEEVTVHKLCRPAGLVCCWMICLKNRDTSSHISLLPTRPCPGQSSQRYCVQAWLPPR